MKRKKYPYVGVWVYDEKRAIVMFTSHNVGYCLYDEFYNNPTNFLMNRGPRLNNWRTDWAEKGFTKITEPDWPASDPSKCR